MKYSLRYLEYVVAAVDRGSTASSTKLLSQPAYFEFIKQGKNDLAIIALRQKLCLLT